RDVPVSGHCSTTSSSLMKRRASSVAWVRFWSLPISARLRLCRLSRPTKANATTVSATRTSMRVKPAAGRARRPTRRSSLAEGIDVAGADVDAAGEAVGHIEGVGFLAVVEVDRRRFDEAVGEEVGDADAFVDLAERVRQVEV